MGVLYGQERPPDIRISHPPVLVCTAGFAQPKDNSFFERPILNSPYGLPDRHWELDAQGQPTQRIMANANRDANPELSRLALKLATGAGKTTVMAMIIAWQTINAIRRPGSSNFTRGFLVVTPAPVTDALFHPLNP